MDFSTRVEVTGLERDPALAEAARAHCQHTVVVDLERETPALVGIFDAAVFADVLEHLSDPLKTLRALCGRVAVDGTIVVSVPNIAHLWIRLGLLLGRFEYRRTRALQAYVRRALDNRICEELRHRRPLREDADECPSLRDPPPGPLQQLVERELVDRYELALARLRPTDLEAVFAKLELGCEFAEIADALGKPTAEAKGI